MAFRRRIFASCLAGVIFCQTIPTGFATQSTARELRARALELAYNLDHDPAIELLRQAVAASPSDPAPHRTLACRVRDLGVSYIAEFRDGAVERFEQVDGQPAGLDRSGDQQIAEIARGSRDLDDVAVEQIHIDALRRCGGLSGRAEDRIAAGARRERPAPLRHLCDGAARRVILAESGQQLHEGVTDFRLGHVIDARSAVHEAVPAMADNGDIVLLAGKGHETGQIVGSGKDERVLPFDDVAVARECAA